MNYKQSRGTIFGRKSALYDKVRPSYPPRVIDAIVSCAKLTKKSRILDVGAGTGKATLLFAKRGYKVVALEPDRRMLSIARKSLRRYGATFVNSSFEKAQIGEKFDLIICAQAVHWLDDKVKYRKMQELLAPNGCVAIFWTLQDRKRSVFARKREKILERYKDRKATPISFTRADREFAIMRKTFPQVRRRLFRWTMQYTLENMRLLNSTLSWIIRLPDARRQAFEAQMDKTLLQFKWPVTILQQTTVLLARNKGTTNKFSTANKF